MMASLFSAFPELAAAAIVFVIVVGMLICYALRIKGDVFAELSLGKTSFRIDARDKRQPGKRTGT